PYTIDVHAPKPIADAWHIKGETSHTNNTSNTDNTGNTNNTSNTSNTNNILTIGDKIKVTLTLNEAVTLAKVGSNKIMIAG
ncbi:hypothetical protein BGC33_00280, partial [Bathymodiolus thermophilus thioautotrophic gill symbiont]